MPVSASRLQRVRSKGRTLLVLTSAVGAVAILVRRGPRTENPCEIQVRSAPSFTGAFSALTLTVSQRHLDHYFLSELEPAVSGNKDSVIGELDPSMMRIMSNAQVTFCLWFV